MLCHASGSAGSATLQDDNHSSIAVDILGTGAHRHVEIHIPAAIEACPMSGTPSILCLMFELPAALYFDPYELDRVLLRQNAQLFNVSSVDLETCALAPLK